MNRIAFGTDGIRSQVGQFPITPEGFNLLGQACRAWLMNQGLPLKLAVGWDTRESGPALAQAFADGMGANARIVFLGITPTPGISLYVEHEKMALGVAITASHNPYTDNGFKLFGGNGAKLSRLSEQAIEQVAEGLRFQNTRCSVIQTVSGSDYVLAYWKQRLTSNAFAGRKIVLDTANGATVFTTLPLLRYLGLEVVSLGNDPNGRNINEQCGSEHVEGLRKAVVDSKAWLGFAQDGDGDRLRVIDEQGSLLDGDCVLGLLAIDAFAHHQLKNNCLVCTEQSNSGLSDSLRSLGIETIQCGIGDREVFYALESVGGNLGGESSGHIILKDEAPTGDGLRVLLRLLTLAQQQPLYQRAQQIHLCPKAEASLPVKQKLPLEQLSHLNKLRERLTSAKRIHIRYSGTENKLRFLVESSTQQECAEQLQALMQAAEEDFKD
ncbi:MAG: phosphoglucosamine mutase [Opitutales bacterium]|nr:phosphoglucosamine mutase [Opitutales bacterium]